MRRRLILMLAAILLSACSPTPSVPPSGPVASGSSPLGTPAVDCLGGVSQPTCDEVLPVVLDAVAKSGWTPTNVWIGSGFFCPREDCLFDPDQNFPVAAAPSDGEWVASAEIAFAETDKHAALHVARVGAGLVPVLIGYRVPLPTWCSGDCPTAAVTDGPYRLELVLPHLDWKTDEAITGHGILGFDGGAPTTIYGSGGGVIAFAFDEIGGHNRHIDWVMTADCGPHALDPATPISVSLFKGGGFSDSDPDAAFMRSFLADPQIHLPAGTWDITATAIFNDTVGCVGLHEMKVTQRITVTDR